MVWKTVFFFLEKSKATLQGMYCMTITCVVFWLLYGSHCVHLYYTVGGRQWSLQWIRVLYKAVTDTSGPPRACAFKVGRHYTLWTSYTKLLTAAGGLTCSVLCPQGRLLEGHKPTTCNTAVLSSHASAFLTKTSFPLTRNWTLNGPEMAKAFAIFRVASFT